jgi:hypothetical protein
VNILYFEINFSFHNYNSPKIIKDSNCHIGITLGNDDVIYCAAMFEHPCYFLCIKLEQFVSNLYRESLKELDSYRDDSDGNLSSGELSISRS